MSRRDASSRATASGTRKSETEPMTTRGSSSGNLQEEGESSESQIDIDTLLSETQIPEDVMASILKLPASVEDLKESETVEILSVHELSAILKVLSIPMSPVAETLKQGSRSRKDRSVQVKSEMLLQIVNRLGDGWKTLHEEVKRRKNPPKRSRRPGDAKTVTITITKIVF